MYSPLLAAVLFVAYVLILLGASFLAGRLFNILICFRRLPKQYEFISGFGFFPVIISYIGLSGLGSIHPLIQALALVSALAGAYWVWNVLRNTRWKRSIKEWAMIGGVPLVAMALLLIAKYCYFGGGTNFSDEFRSVQFVGAFATNNLKPAFPYDFSLPLSYSYYFFEGAAFLYAAVRGFLVPSIALLAATLVSVAVAFRILWLICTELFAVRTLRSYFLVTLLLTFSSLDGLVRPVAGWLGINLHNQLQFHPIYAYFQNNYQYLYCIGLCALGALLGLRFLREKKTEYWFACTAFFAMALGYATITFLWAAVGFAVVLLFTIRGKDAWMRLIKTVPGTLGVLILMLLPQFAIFMPRLLHVTELSLPHLWFPYDINHFVESSAPRLRLVLHVVSLILTDLGPLLTIGAFAAPVLLLLRVKKRNHFPDHLRPLLPFAMMITVVMILMTVTMSPVSDWFVRGFFVAQYLSAFVIAMIADQLLTGSRWKVWGTAGAVILTITAASFVTENVNAMNTCRAISPKAAALNVRYPLGTIFVITEEHLTPLEEDIRDAGRAVINPFNKIMSSYLNSDDFLMEKLGAKSIFAPCEVTLYGKSTPEGKAMVQTVNGDWTVATCEEGS